MSVLVIPLATENINYSCSFNLLSTTFWRIQTYNFSTLCFSLKRNKCFSTLQRWSRARNSRLVGSHLGLLLVTVLLLQHAISVASKSKWSKKLKRRNKGFSAAGKSKLPCLWNCNQSPVMFYLICAEKTHVMWTRQCSLQIAIVIAAVFKAKVVAPKPAIGSQEPGVRVLCYGKIPFLLKRLSALSYQLSTAWRGREFVVPCLQLKLCHWLEENSGLGTAIFWIQLSECSHRREKVGVPSITTSSIL